MVTTWNILGIKGADCGAPYGTVVTDVDYVVIASQEGSTLTAERKGAARIAKLKVRAEGGVTVGGIDPAAFLQYDTVTEQDVVQWVKSFVGAEVVGILELTVTQELRSKLEAAAVTPTKPTALTPPWVQEE
jgi:hypothetical protein